VISSLAILVPPPAFRLAGLSRANYRLRSCLKTQR
jgi:hypothetical protein